MKFLSFDIINMDESILDERQARYSTEVDKTLRAPVLFYAASDLKSTNVLSESYFLFGQDLVLEITGDRRLFAGQKLRCVVNQLYLYEANLSDSYDTIVCVGANFGEAKDGAASVTVALEINQVLVGQIATVFFIPNGKGVYLPLHPPRSDLPERLFFDGQTIVPRGASHLLSCVFASFHSSSVAREEFSCKVPPSILDPWAPCQDVSVSLTLGNYSIPVLNKFQTCPRPLVIEKVHP